MPPEQMTSAPRLEHVFSTPASQTERLRACRGGSSRPRGGQWSRFGRWADKSARPELVEGRAVGCSWFDRLTTSVGTDIGAQQTRPLPAVRAVIVVLSLCASVSARPAGGAYGTGAELRLQASVEPVRSHPVIIQRP